MRVATRMTLEWKTGGPGATKPSGEGWVRCSPAFLLNHQQETRFATDLATAALARAAPLASHPAGFFSLPHVRAGCHPGAGGSSGGRGGSRRNQGPAGKGVSPVRLRLTAHRPGWWPEVKWGDAPLIPSSIPSTSSAQQVLCVPADQIGRARHVAGLANLPEPVAAAVGLGPPRPAGGRCGLCGPEHLAPLVVARVKAGVCKLSGLSFHGQFFLPPRRRRTASQVRRPRVARLSRAPPRADSALLRLLLSLQVCAAAEQD